MANQFDHRIWGVADFKRYHGGTMADAERHALEKASLEDPFLQDALDGYMYAQHPEEDLAEIKQKIWPVEKRELAPVVWYKRKGLDIVWKAAAVLIIMGGFTWLIISNNNTKEPQDSNDNFASLKKTETKQETSNQAPKFDTLIAQAESGNAIAKLDPPASEVEKVLSPVAQSSSPVQTPALEDESFNRVEHVRVDTFKTATEPVVVSNAAESKISDIKFRSPQKDLAKKESQKQAGIITGKVVDEEGMPVPYASVIIQNSNGVQADMDGNFSLTNNNSRNDKVQIQASAANYGTTNVAVSNNSNNNNIVLAEKQQNLSEVVVTGAFNKTKASRTTTAASSNVSINTKWNAGNSRVLLQGAEPLNGWNYFYSYMNDSSNLQNNSFTKKGEVVLRFKIDSIGKPKDVKVIRSLIGAADTLSKNILQQAPPLRILNEKKPAEARFFFR